MKRSWTGRSSPEDPESGDSSSGSDEDVLATPHHLKNKAPVLESAAPSMFTHTSFDAYFTQNASSSKTSDNVFSLSPLSQEEYDEAIASIKYKPPPPEIWPGEDDDAELCTLFSQYLRELCEGFNLLFYGFGSKRVLLNRFAAGWCAKAGHVVVLNGFHPHFSLKDLVGAIERVPGVLETPLPAGTGGLEAQIHRIYDHFAQEDQATELFLIVHNIDSAQCRGTKLKSCLALLAQNPRIHVATSVDHVHAALLWGAPEIAARTQHRAPARGWLWHDLTTCAPYDAELAHADRAAVGGAHGGARAAQEAGVSGGAAGMTETAARHVLAAVTERAKKLFVLMAAKQLEAMDRADGPAAPAAGDLQAFAVGYDVLFAAARDEFIVPNDAALKSLLGEFRDHQLVLAAPAPGAGGAGGEVLWIPLRKERLQNVLKGLQGAS